MLDFLLNKLLSRVDHILDLRVRAGAEILRSISKAHIAKIQDATQAYKQHQAASVSGGRVVDALASFDENGEIIGLNFIWLPRGNAPSHPYAAQYERRFKVHVPGSHALDGT